MARQIQLRRGTTSQHSTFTGALGEVTVDTDKDVVVVHDGSTAGGFPAVKATSLSTVATTGDYDDLNNLPTLGTAAATDSTAYATAAQGNLADSAIQSGDLATVATTGAYSDLSGTPTLATVATSGDYTDLSNTPTIPVSGTDFVAKSGGTFTGDITIDGELIADSYNETYAAVTSSSNATTVNCENANSFSHTLTENTTFTFSNPPASGTSYTFSIEIIQDASASGYTVTWPSSVDWPAATAPTLTATASAKDIFVFTTRDGGTTFYGFTAGQALA